MFHNEDDGYTCLHCTQWIQDTGNWFCDECKFPVCERCGTYDDEEDAFLCPDCFETEPVHG